MPTRPNSAYTFSHDGGLRAGIASPAMPLFFSAGTPRHNRMTQHNQPPTPLQVLMSLQVLLATIQRRWDAGDDSGAAEIARLAAPYVHPRRTTTQATREPDQMTDAELLTALRQDAAGEDGAGMATAPDDPEQPA